MMLHRPTDVCHLENDIRAETGDRDVDLRPKTIPSRYYFVATSRSTKSKNAPITQQMKKM